VKNCLLSGPDHEVEPRSEGGFLGYSIGASFGWIGELNLTASVVLSELIAEGPAGRYQGSHFASRLEKLFGLSDGSPGCPMCFGRLTHSYTRKSKKMRPKQKLDVAAEGDHVSHTQKR
jgi:hypothetical protein